MAFLRKHIFRIFFSIVCAVVFCRLFFILHWILTASPVLRSQYVPDDSFYYLTLAKNFCRFGRWTFDSGVSLTSGFHLLHAYALAAIYWLFEPGDEAFVKTDVWISFLAALPAMVGAAFFCWRLQRVFPCLLLLLFVLSRNVSICAISGLEWGWVVSLSALYFYLLYCLGVQSPQTSRRSIHFLSIGIFACGFMGSMARSDFGLMPLACALAAIPCLRGAWGWRTVFGACCGLVGSAVGVGAIFLHNYWATGQATQSSALMKSLWLKTYGPAAIRLLEKIVELFGPVNMPSLILFLILVAMSVLLGSIRLGWPWIKFLFSQSAIIKFELVSPTESVGALKKILWMASVITLIGYTFVYRLNPAALQLWYTANLIVPLFLALCLPFEGVTWKDVRDEDLTTNASVDALTTNITTNLLSWGAVVLVAVMVVRQTAVARGFTKKPEWPLQEAMYQAGHFIRDKKIRGVGSFNAGIIGYYEGGHVVNLDGLVNNDIYEYARRNRMADYLDAKGIKYILDCPGIFQDARYRKRGGYDDPELLKRLKPLGEFDDEKNPARNLTLIEILPRPVK